MTPCKKTWTGWIVTAPWYDSRNIFPGSVWRTRKDAIDDFMENWPPEDTWRQKKREGWRCTKVVFFWE